MPVTAPEEPRPLLDEKRLGFAMNDWARQCGRRLVARRKVIGWNQTRVAELVGVTTASISKFEIGIAVPRDSVRLAIACALMCEVVDIWPPLERFFVTAVAREAAA